MRPTAAAGSAFGWRRWLVVGLAWAAPAVSAAAATAAVTTPPPCRLPGLPNEVRCGQLTRPLNPAQPQGPQIEVHYAVLPALTRQPRPDPLFVLAGGPGQSAIDLAPQVAGLFRRLNQQRDIVLVDQRGTGRSAPLVCEEPRHEPLAAQALGPQVERLMRCRDVLARQAPLREVQDLRWFTTSVAVQDLDAVRHALGFARVNLIGGSYGTRVALEWLRQHPTHVRRGVLDGVAPPDMALPHSSGQDAEAAFEALLKACDTEPGCSARHPKLRRQWRDLMAGLPRAISVTHPVDGRRETVTLTPDLLAAWVRGPLYRPSLASALPAALAAAAEDDRWEGLVGLNAVLSARQGPAQVALGMHFSVVCAEDQPAVPAPAAGTSLRWNDSGRQLYAQVCAQWPRGEVPAGFTTVATSPVPWLLLSGGLDPITPPRHGQRMAEALGPLARHVVLPHAGHGLMGVGCLGEVITRFFDSVDDAGALAVDAGCAQDVPRPPMFELPRPPGSPLQRLSQPTAATR
ncbi:MAG: alpha/beta hydrolase [Pseudomonadota bacterium]